ncbi:DUF1768-domain-containing protein [Astrocystis sublimbata]|nr:DUF1768-domain-containing protein [Astrocystis sublimbata]
MPSNRNRSSKKPTVASLPTSSSPPPPPAMNEEPEPVYFWRPSSPTTGFLSQWYASAPFRDRDPSSDKVYATAEHYMMHHKALLFGDEQIAAAILEVSGTYPKAVKDLGRKVRGFDQAVWERERERIVRDGNWCKFSLPLEEEGGGHRHGKSEDNDKEEGKGEAGGVRAWKLGDGDDAEVVHAASFRDVLIKVTGDRELAEASPFDRVWGIGFVAKNADTRRRDKWGLNLLGKCLMEVRDEWTAENTKEVQGE